EIRCASVFDGGRLSSKVRELIQHRTARRIHRDVAKPLAWRRGDQISRPNAAFQRAEVLVPPGSEIEAAASTTLAVAQAPRPFADERCVRAVAEVTRVEIIDIRRELDGAHPARRVLI